MQQFLVVARYLLVALATTAVLLTLLSVGPEPVWWVQILNFPRLQLLLVHAVALAALLAVGARPPRWPHRLLVLGTVAGLALQAYFVLPYTGLGRKTVPDAAPVATGSAAPNRLRLLVVNVLMENRQAEALRQLVQATRPDVLLAMETDAWWVRELRPLRAQYPYRVELPRANTYGMVLYSRLPLLRPQVKYLEHPAVPSIHVGLRLPGGQIVAFHGVHPPPPVPLEYLDKKSDYEEVTLLKVGALVKQAREPAIVAGDFNDVAWSRTTRLFEADGQLRNVRLGRGLYSSFRATSLVMRWPLDHVFVTPRFRLADLRRLPGNGSDHFPIYVELVLSEAPAP